MKKIVLGMILLISSLSFSSDKKSTSKMSNIFENFKKEKSQDQMDTKNELKISNIFSNKK